MGEGKAELELDRVSLTALSRSTNTLFRSRLEQDSGVPESLVLARLDVTSDFNIRIRQTTTTATSGTKLLLDRDWNCGYIEHTVLPPNWTVYGETACGYSGRIKNISPPHHMTARMTRDLLFLTVLLSTSPLPHGSE